MMAALGLRECRRGEMEVGKGRFSFSLWINATMTNGYRLSIVGVFYRLLLAFGEIGASERTGWGRWFIETLWGIYCIPALNQYT